MEIFVFIVLALVALSGCDRKAWKVKAEVTSEIAN